MSQHVIQKRDLLEMLKPFTDDFRIKAKASHNEAEMFFDSAEQREGQIVVNMISPKMERELDDLRDEAEMVSDKIDEANALIKSKDLQTLTKEELIELVNSIYAILP